MIKRIGYSLVGLVLGSISGLLFGIIVGSAVTKDSEQATRMAVQVVILVPLGAVAGAVMGFKMAGEELHVAATPVRYVPPPQPQANCQYCRSEFTYRDQGQAAPDLCPNCNSFRCQCISSAMQAARRCHEEVPRLKRLHSKLERYDLALDAISQMVPWKGRGFHFGGHDPDMMTSNLVAHRDASILDHIKSETRTVFRDVQLEPEKARKLKKLNLFSDKLGNYQKFLTSGKDEVFELERFFTLAYVELMRSQGGPLWSKAALPSAPQKLPRLLES